MHMLPLNSIIVHPAMHACMPAPAAYGVKRKLYSYPHCCDHTSADRLSMLTQPYADSTHNPYTAPSSFMVARNSWYCASVLTGVACCLGAAGLGGWLAAPQPTGGGREGGARRGLGTSLSMSGADVMAERWMGARPNPKSAGFDTGRAGAFGLTSSLLTLTDAGTMLVSALSFCASGRLTTVLLPVMVALTLAAAADAADADADAEACAEY
jgi:hypothetical protein